MRQSLLLELLVLRVRAVFAAHVAALVDRDAQAAVEHLDDSRGDPHIDSEHMPSSHRRYAEWTPDRFRRWAGKIGPNTEGLISAVLASRPHPEQRFRTRLGRSYRGLDVARLEAGSARAVELGVLNGKGVAVLLARKPDDAASKDNRPTTLFDRANLRGQATTIERNSSC
jgi:hypothetical protein